MFCGTDADRTAVTTVTDPGEAVCALDPRQALHRLAAVDGVLLIGVRHHSPALAAAVPALLDAAAPGAVLVELPEEMQPWLDLLADPQTTAPVALAAVAGDDRPVAFYPFADFSPELAALRWAQRHGVPAHCCDLPLGDPGWQQLPQGSVPAAAPETPAELDAHPRIVAGNLGARVASGLTGRAGDDLWDRWVEAVAPGSPAEAVRRAGLAAGWTLRRDACAAGAVPALDLRREQWMRHRIAATPGRVAVVVGAFHAPALLTAAQPRVPDGAPPPATPPPAPARPAGSPPHAAGSWPQVTPSPPPRVAAQVDAVQAVVSLVPYSFELLDERSGYPAGIRDPRWQQAVHDAPDPASQHARAGEFAVEVTRHLRGQGHPAGPAEAAEIARLASDLARLRHLPAPARGELVEAMQTVLAQGEPVGRGRAVAAAMQQVMVGDRRGRPCPQTPVCGLHPSVVSQLKRLRLPGPDDPARTVRLDPLRSLLDRDREVAIARLTACQVPYADATPGTSPASIDTLTSVWRLHWRPATDAALAAAGRHGVTLAQATAGMLQVRRHREAAAGGPTAAQALGGLAQATACGLAEVTQVRLDDLRTVVIGGGTFAEVTAALQLLQRIQRGHVPGTPSPPPGLEVLIDELYAAGVAAIEGLAGSTSSDDARALVALARDADAAGYRLRLDHSVARLSDHGSPLMRGAASAVRVVLGTDAPGAFSHRLASWTELPGPECTGRLRGALVATGALLQAGGQTLTPLLDLVDGWDDGTFTRRLPALRGGFDVLSPADRERLLDTITRRLGDMDATTIEDPGVLADWLAIDQVGRDALAALRLADGSFLPLAPDGGGDAQGHTPPAAGPTSRTPSAPDNAQPTGRPERGDVHQGGGSPRPPRGQVLIPPEQRWRLLLGRQPENLAPHARRLATALDELYGRGEGEGSHTAGSAGGRQRPYPQVRDWAEDLEALFGATVRDEVLARAAESGRPDAALLLAPDRVRPSVDLLRTVLSLAGGLPEARLARLRPLVARLVADLTAQLARRIRPALTGIGIPRRTRRPTGRLDLDATVRANLRTARTAADGTVRVVPERVIFRSRGRRSVDWQIILLVDVSGSMEPSTVWAALTASVLAGVPSLRTHFVTFSTEVVDLTDRAGDPLGLLLEIRVGGGTHIAAALRYARQITTTPARTMVVLISDFEEGYPLGDLLAAVRALADDGVRLLGCASLDDAGQARYSTAIAGQLVDAGMPVAALSPTELARWIGDQVR